ncbi:hypothetical protein [Paucibacter sp. XJ19-41]|uniref:hypothetical protein n=1 Tax=Paucibacter sp. XJ19-41 TaxID=2927824 RepID=UPI002349EFD6|nr:hypothetical protein [Paucibacter sp. XJ19-41]
MSAVLIRVLMQGVVWLLPAAQSGWAKAMRAEVAEMADEGEALSFAFGCLKAALQLACERAGQRGLQRVQRVRVMGLQAPYLGLLGASAAVLLGCGFMVWADAPRPMAWMNGLSLAFALASLALLPRRSLQRGPRLRSILCAALGALLLASTALAPMSGVIGRWLHLGPVHVQPVWILLPCLLLLSRPRRGVERSRGDSLGLLMAVAALVLQAELIWLMVMSLVLWQRGWQHRGEPDAPLAVLAMLGAAAVAQIWQVPAHTPFVDQVLQSGFERHAGLGLLLGLGSLLLLLPALFHRNAREHGLIWGGLSLAAWMGWVSTPLLGLGGSAILGYVLSLAALPGPAAVAGSALSDELDLEPKPTGRGSHLPKTGLT